MLFAMLNVSLVFAVASAQPTYQSKGGFNIQSSDLSRGRPTKPGSGGIATGDVSDPSGARYAIIIGISDYAGSINDLDYCDDDAFEFKAALIADGWKTPKDHIILLIDGDATRTAILNAIDAVAGAAGVYDEVVFFYSGHGSISNFDVDSDGEKRDECIIPYECTVANYIWDGDLEAKFSGCASQRMMFFFDSCYAGGMIDLAGPGRLLCMACGENQLSLESSTWQNGQFTYYFVDLGMKQGFADKNGDASVTFEEAFDYAKANCQRQTPVASDGFTPWDMLP